jgi:hypothetical protein
MTAQTFREIVLRATEGLSDAALEEIASYVLLVRKRELQPRSLSEEIENELLRLELKKLSRQEEAHLEEEFDDYERRYPAE